MTAVVDKRELQRKAAIKKLQAGKRALNMADADYRAMLLSHTGKTSSTQCTLAQLGVLLEFLKRAGFVDQRGANADGRKRLVPAADRQALMAMVHVALRELGHARGEVLTLAYADAICAKREWCTRVDFASPQVLHQLVGVLQHNLRAKQKQAARAAS